MTWLRSPGFRRGSWIVIAALAIVSLGRATFDDGPPRTMEEQVEAIARTLKCPACDGQSVADSDVAASRAIRVEIARLVEEGQTPDEIRGGHRRQLRRARAAGPTRDRVRGPGVDPPGGRPRGRPRRCLRRAGPLATHAPVLTHR